MEVLANPSYQLCAEALGESIREEHGITSAIQKIHGHLGITDR